MTAREWYAADVTTTTAGREAVEYGLMEAGALGTETVEENGAVRVTAYFEEPIETSKVRDALDQACRIYNCHFIEIDELDVQVRSVAERDWLAEWKKSWRPVELGRFIVAPPWLVSEPRAIASGSTSAVSSNSLSDKIVIQIDPGMAFGTGTHETTRLCLKAIDEHYRGGSFLDVGTGTGVLAIAAAKLSRDTNPSNIRACDIDADAIAIAAENARLNGVRDRIHFRVGSVGDDTASADFVCANLTAPVIVELLPELISATCGRLVLSGILNSQLEMVRARLVSLGATDFVVASDGEWVAILV